MTSLIGMGLGLPTWRSGVSPVEYIYRFEFPDDEAAPMATPHVEGDASLTLVQNDGQWSVSGGRAVFPAQTTPAWTDQGAYSTLALTRRAGLAMLNMVRLTTANVGFLGQLRGTSGIGFVATGAGFYYDANGIQPAVGGQQYRLGYFEFGIFAALFRTVGAYFLSDDRLFWVDDAENAASLYYAFTNYSNAGALDYIRVADLTAPYTDADGLVLESVASPVTGETVTGARDGLIYFTWTPAASEVLNIRYRYVDDDNCMIVRCDQAGSTIKLIRRLGGSETERASASQTFTAGTPYRMWVRYAGDRTWASITTPSAAPRISNQIDGFQLDKTGVKIDGFASGASLKTYPFYLSGTALTVWKRYANPYEGGYATRNVVEVEDGGDITAAIATMRRGDILSLAANGTYTIAGGSVGIASLPNGFPDYPTEVRGNGATITGGTYGIQLTDTRYFKISGVNFLDQTSYCQWFLRCRNWEITDCTFESTVGGAFADATHFDKCQDFSVSNCVAGPVTGVASCDGFECYGECVNGTFTNCVAHGAVHGFEAWSGSSPNWKNVNISFVNCEAYDCTVGFSTEGGVQSLAHENIVCIDCDSHDNTEYGYQGVEGATLYRQNCTAGNNALGETNGSVVDL